MQVSVYVRGTYSVLCTRSLLTKEPRCIVLCVLFVCVYGCVSIYSPFTSLSRVAGRFVSCMEYGVLLILTERNPKDVVVHASHRTHQIHPSIQSNLMSKIDLHILSSPILSCPPQSHIYICPSFDTTVQCRYDVRTSKAKG